MKKIIITICCTLLLISCSVQNKQEDCPKYPNLIFIYINSENQKEEKLRKHEKKWDKLELEAIPKTAFEPK